MITILGHTFRPEALTYVSPVQRRVKTHINVTHFYMTLTIGGQNVDVERDTEQELEKVRANLLTALGAKIAMDAGY